uniref:Ig-like domain-containing protein n=1 Tax=Esox lucius TaxID=8010 RepID=A0AAY5KZN9_ESOLU
MKGSSVVTILLLKAFIGEVCQAINVTVTPSPFLVAQEGENVTLTCLVSQRRRSASLPVVKWTFLPEHSSSDEELLIARVNMRKARFYGNYTKSFPWPKLKLTVVKQGKIFDLLIMNISAQDRGLYICRVQEFRKHQNRWKASSNSTAATELRGKCFFGCGTMGQWLETDTGGVGSRQVKVVVFAAVEPEPGTTAD